VKEIKLRKMNYKTMKIIIQCVAISFMVIFLTNCASNDKKAIEEFSKQYTKAQNDYCSTNIFLAEQGVENFREWLLDTNHPTKPALNRDLALYLINGRLFLIEEHIGNTNQVEKFYQESVDARNRYLQYLQSLHLPPEPHPLEPISSKEQLRERFALIEKNLDVGWRKQSKP
jgi:hypothetical protein